MKKNLLYLLIILVISACHSSTQLIPQKKLDRKNYLEVNGILDEPQTELDKSPMYPNGIYGIQKHIAIKTKYPLNAIRNRIEGRVVVEFIIETDGTIQEAKVIESVDEELDEEAVRVILALDQWYPGFDNEKPVRVSFALPINFKLP